ncbi:fibronectin type III domain-containing protein [Actinoplanes sp. NPDC048796]|uniref:fibronectin type III domain-containing protein n=1 Tax=Actinoplanes sp. NPDC048796 TaxID=3155640 RepID=UPI0033D2CD4F
MLALAAIIAAGLASPAAAKDTQTADLPWHLDRDDQRPVKRDQRFNHGVSDVPIYIVDSGVWAEHTEFGGRVVKFADVTGAGQDGKPCRPHGTAVASAAAGRTRGVSKQSPIMSVKVSHCDEATSVQLRAGLDAIALHGRAPAVVNISLAYKGVLPEIESGIETLVKRGYTVVTGANNTMEPACGWSPAQLAPRLAGMITVGGSDQNDNRWVTPEKGSGDGSCVEIFAPAADLDLASTEDAAAMAFFEGNSGAAPQVAGAAALIIAAHPNYTPGQVEAALMADATKKEIYGTSADSPKRLLFVAPPAQPGKAIPSRDLNELFNRYGDAGGHWTGGDETMSLKLPDGRVAWFFGDTFLGQVEADHSRSRDTRMIHNSVVVQDGMTLTATLHGGTAASPSSLVATGPDDTPGDFGWWPSEGLVAGDEVQVFYTHVVDDGQGGPLPFKTDEIAVARFSASTLALLGLSRLPGLGVDRPISWGSALVDGEDGYTYVYGREIVDKHRRLYVARVPQGQLTDRAQWRFWTGAATPAEQWSASQADASSVMTGVGASFSVKYIPAYQSFVLVTFDESEGLDNRIFAYHAGVPTGPFRHGSLIHRATEATASRYTYNARLHLEQDAGGATAVISYNVNSFDPDEVYRDARVYRPRFVNATIPGPPESGTWLPDAPRNLQAVLAGNAKVRLTWDPVPQVNLVQYWVYERRKTFTPTGRDVGATHFTRRSTPVPSPETEFDVAYAGVYEYRVSAETLTGEGPPSIPASLPVPLPAPSQAPPNLTGTANPDGSVTLIWDEVTTPEPWLVNYRVYQRDTTSDDPQLRPARNAVVNGTTARVSGLRSGTPYEFQVTAYNNSGESPRSNTVRVTPTAPPPPAPTGLTATPNTDGSIRLAWTATGPGHWYWVWMRKSGETQFTKLEYPVTTGTTFTASYLTNNQAYDFRVSAISTNGAEGPPSAIASATSRYAPPPVPANLTATSNNDGSIGLSWSSSGPGIWYWVWTRNVSNGETEFGKSVYPVVSGTTHTAGWLEIGDVYEFRVSALGPGEAESAQSNTARATSRIPPPGAPANLSATAGNGRATLTWSAPEAGLMYWVYYRPVGQAAFNRFDLPANNVTTFTALPLTNGQTYEFYVTAVKAGVESSPSNVVQARPQVPPPPAPGNLTATPDADGNVRLSWVSSGPSMFYWIEMRDVSAGQAFRRLDLPLQDRTTFTATGLVLNHTYEFRVAAANAGGESPLSNVARGVTFMPVPTRLTAHWEDHRSAQLAWDGDPAGMYWIYVRDVAAGGGFQRQSLPTSGRISQIIAPLRSSAYEFYVTRVGYGGETAPSNVASLGPQHPTPPAGNLVTATSAGPSSCHPVDIFWICQSTITTTARLTDWSQDFRAGLNLNVEWGFSGSDSEAPAIAVCEPLDPGVPRGSCTVSTSRKVTWNHGTSRPPASPVGPTVCVNTSAWAPYFLDQNGNWIKRTRTDRACVNPGGSA